MGQLLAYKARHFLRIILRPYRVFNVLARDEGFHRHLRMGKRQQHGQGCQRRSRASFAPLPASIPSQHRAGEDARGQRGQHGISIRLRQPLYLLRLKADKVGSDDHPDIEQIGQPYAAP